MTSSIQRSFIGQCGLLLLVGCAVAQHLELSLLSTYSTNVFDKGASEITSYDPCTKKVISTNSFQKRVDIMDLSASGTLQYTTSVDLTLYGIDPNSVAINSRGGYFVVAGTNITNATSTGAVVFFKTSDNSFLGSVTVGAIPDMVTFALKGTRLLVANEGEVQGASNPEGSVSIISNIKLNPFRVSVATVGFTQFNGQEDALRAQGIRIFPGVSASLDFEPEYISTFGNIAYVTLQENNAVAVINIMKARVERLIPLGLKDHSIPGNGLDINDNDKVANIVTRDNVVGMYMPDTIAVYSPSWAAHHFVTANEGDARSENKRVKDPLNKYDPIAFPDDAFIRSDPGLGRIQMSTIDGLNADGNFTKIHVYGTRSFSIFNQQGQVVFDSGDDFETKTAALYGGFFNSNSDSNASNDTRSDDKGPEPEALAVGTIKGYTYAFIGLERMGGVMVSVNYTITILTFPPKIYEMPNHSMSNYVLTTRCTTLAHQATLIL
jgi:2',3'-cyclic-nucleotide 2'-phosphodiesterase / 3'-nucleotidase / 5'-nucleotidase